MLLGFFVFRMRAAPLAELAELQSLFDRFLVLFGVVADFFTLGALELDAIILGHRIFTLVPGGYQNRLFSSTLAPSPLIRQRRIKSERQICNVRPRPDLWTRPSNSRSGKRAGAASRI